jgi:soluble lytic murein transglycosylase
LVLLGGVLLLFLFGCCSILPGGNVPEGAYFAGLHELDAKHPGWEERAIRFFTLGSKKASPLAAKLCDDELLRLGDRERRVKTAREYAARWQDGESLLAACRVLFEAGKYKDIIKTTEKQGDDFPPALVRLRLASLLKYNSQEFQQEAAAWFRTVPFTAEHQSFLSEYQLPESFTPEEIALIQIRLAGYTRNYGQAYNLLRARLAPQTDRAAWLGSLPQSIFSEIGRILVYCGADYAENARLLDQVAATRNPLVYYALFYAGRLYDWSGPANAMLAADRFMQAAITAPSPEQRDDALWYYLNTLFKTGPDQVIRELSSEALQFHDKRDFADFFDTLSVSLLQNKQWVSFYAVAKLLPGLANEGTVSKYAYIAGRLLEEGLVAPESGQARAEAAEALFWTACSPGADVYYALLGAAKLGLNAAETEKLILSPAIEKTAEISVENERFLAGFLQWDFLKGIYPQWLKLRETISLDQARLLANALENQEDEPLRRQGLLMAAYTLRHSRDVLSKEDYALAFPRFFRAEIEASGAEFSVPDYLIYSLVRNESFFDPSVTSRAGAKGLTQLMDTTAEEVAAKLRAEEYDLFDGKTNIRLGVYYLADLLRRFEGSLIPALSAYNAGASRTRGWLRSSGLPLDLWLETIPYGETRNYCRNVLSAAALYCWLYNGLPLVIP